MWSSVSVLEGANDGSGFTLRALRVLRNVDLCLLQAAQTKWKPLLGIREALKGMVKNGDAIACVDILTWSATQRILRIPKFEASGESRSLKV